MRGLQLAVFASGICHWAGLVILNPPSHLLPAIPSLSLKSLPGRM